MPQTFSFLNIRSVIVRSALAAVIGAPFATAQQATPLPDAPGARRAESSAAGHYSGAGFGTGEAEQSHSACQ